MRDTSKEYTAYVMWKMAELGVVSLDRCWTVVLYILVNVDICSFTDPSACCTCRTQNFVTLNATLSTNILLSLLRTLPSFLFQHLLSVCYGLGPVPGTGNTVVMQNGSVLVFSVYKVLCSECMENTSINKQLLFPRKSQSSGETTHKPYKT